LRPSDVVAASVRQTVPTPSWVFGAVPIGPPSASVPSPGIPEVAIAAVVVPVQASVVNPATAPSPARPSTARLVARRSSGAAVIHPAVVVQVASLPVVVTPPALVVPVIGPRSQQSAAAADLPLASASGLIHASERSPLVVVRSPAATPVADPARAGGSSSSPSHRWRTAEAAAVTPARVDPEAKAVATTRHERSRHRGHRPTPPS
jgi:hypothetical protein